MELTERSIGPEDLRDIRKWLDRQRKLKRKYLRIAKKISGGEKHKRLTYEEAFKLFKTYETEILGYARKIELDMEKYFLLETKREKENLIRQTLVTKKNMSAQKYEEKHGD